MKTFFKNIVLVVLVMAAVFMIAAAPYYMTLVIRTALIDHGTLAVSGLSTFTGRTTHNGGATVNGLLKGNSLVARVDSFYTTSASDSVPWLGARAGDVFLIGSYNPAYATTVDTVFYTYSVGIDTVYPARVKARFTSTGVLTGAKYVIVGVSKQ